MDRQTLDQGRDTIFCVKNKRGKYTNVSDSFIDLVHEISPKKTNDIPIIGKRESDVWGLKIGLSHSEQDKKTWKKGDNVFIEAIITKNDELVFLQYHSYIEGNYIVSEIVKYKPHFLEEIDRYCDETKAFKTKDGETIKMQDLQYLIAYLSSPTVTEAAEKMFRSLAALEKSVGSTSRRLKFRNPKALRHRIVSDHALEPLKAMLDLLKNITS